MTQQNESFLNKIKVAIVRIIQEATTKAPNKLIELIKEAKKTETSDIAIKQYELILENFKYGAEKCIPICQDTGILNFFVELGNQFPIISDFREIIENAVVEATNNIPLRGNTVDPLTNENPENNLGINSPPIYLKIINGSKKLKITVLPKGGGAENISRLFMLNPANGLEELKKKIINTILEAGGMPCPPIILGIGIGGDATMAMYLAKKALLRPLGSKNSRKDVALLEQELKEQINNIKIGVMGLGGEITCLAVHIEVAMRHPASFPVGLIVQCYSHRIASFEMNERGDIIYDI
ncbi:MAG: fumarate hydratase [Promethearchaeia archaeon]